MENISGRGYKWGNLTDGGMLVNARASVANPSIWEDRK